MNIQLDLHHSAVSGPHLLLLQSVNGRLPYSSSIAQYFWSEESLTIGFHKQGYFSKNVRYCRLSLRSDPMLFHNKIMHRFACAQGFLHACTYTLVDVSICTSLKSYLTLWFPVTITVRGGQVIKMLEYATAVAITLLGALHFIQNM